MSKMNTRRMALLSGIALSPVMAFVSPAWAQSNPANTGAPDGAAVVSEIVVTAQRHATSIQNVAATVTALSGAQLATSGATNVTQLQTLTSGLKISQDNALQTQIYIRGVGNNIQGLAASNSVATYVDGVYIPNSIQAFQGFNDVERVEVLKGPQATLYGRNATGGAINIISQQPTFSREGSIDGSVANFEGKSIRGTVSGPLLSTIAGRLSVSYTDHRGYATNVDLGNHPNAEERTSVRGALLFRPNDDLNVILRGDYSRFSGSDYVKNRTNNYLLTTPTGNEFINDPWKIHGDIRDQQKSKDSGIALDVTWMTPLGSVKSVTSARRFESGPYFIEFDNNNSYAIYFNGVGFGASVSSRLGDTAVSDQFYHETYLSTDTTKPFRAIVGATYFHENASLHGLAGKVALVNGLGVISTAQYFRHSKVDAASAYTDFNFDVTQDLTLVAGVRYSWEKRFYSQLPVNAQPGFPTVYQENENSWTDTSPRAGIEYRPRKGLLLFATVTKGFKSGGFNEAAPLNGFDPETIVSYESGVKSTLMDGRLRANVSAFYYDYKDIQVQRVLPFNAARVIENASSAKLYGADVELTVAIFKNLVVGVTATMEHSEFGDSILCNDVAGSCLPGGVGAGYSNPKGNPVPRAPDLSATLNGDYRIDADSLGGRFELHGDASYSSRTYFTPFKDKTFGSTDPFWVLDASLTFRSANDWFVSAFVNNLSDTLIVGNRLETAVPRYLAGPLTGQLIGPPIVSDRFGPPRTYGVRIGYNF